MTPDHAIYESRLIDLAHDLLSPEEARETMTHVGDCAECEARFRVLVADGESLRAGAAPRLVDGRIELVKSARGRKMLLRAGVLAAALALVAIGVFRTIDRDGAQE